MTSDGEFVWRPIEPADAGNWSALLIAIQATDHGWDFFSERDLLEEFGNPDRDFARGSMGIFTGGAMVGYGTLGCRDAADPVHEMRYWGGVHPAYRQRGLGGRLLSWAETAAVPLHRERYPDRPLSLSGSCLSHNAAAVALYAARGYQPVRWFHAMVRDLTTALPEVPAPPGVQITAFTPEQSETARLIRNEAFTDHRGSTETSAEGWAHFMAASAFRPAFSFLAYAGGEAGLRHQPRVRRVRRGDRNPGPLHRDTGDAPGRAEARSRLRSAGPGVHRGQGRRIHLGVAAGGRRFPDRRRRALRAGGVHRGPHLGHSVQAAAAVTVLP